MDEHLIRDGLSSNSSLWVSLQKKKNDLPTPKVHFHTNNLPLHRCGLKELGILTWKWERQREKYIQRINASSVFFSGARLKTSSLHNVNEARLGGALSSASIRKSSTRPRSRICFSGLPSALESMFATVETSLPGKEQKQNTTRA